MVAISFYYPKAILDTRKYALGETRREEVRHN